MKTFRIVSKDRDLVHAASDAVLRTEFSFMEDELYSAAEALYWNANDVLLLDLRTCETDEIELCARTLKLSFDFEPNIFAITDKENETVRGFAKECFLQPVDVDAMLKCIQSISSVKRECAFSYTILRRQTSDMLISMGIFPNYAGFAYLRTALMHVIMTSNEPKLSMMEELYPLVAGMHNCAPSKVNKAMHSAILAAWSHADIDLLHRYFGYTVSEEHEAPTNAAFIFMMSRHLKERAA